MLAARLSLLWLLFCSLLPHFAVAQNSEEPTRWYTTEIILFQTKKILDGFTEEPVKSGAVEEYWHRYMSVADPVTLTNSITAPVTSDNIAPLQNLLAYAKEPFNALVPFQSVPTDALQLTKIARSLQLSSRYTLLHYFSWVQPGLPEKEAIAIRLTPHSSAPVALETASSMAHRPAFRKVEMDANQISHQFEIDGTVTISLSRYLHADFDLLISDYTDIPAPTSVAAPEGVVIYSDQNSNSSKRVLTQAEITAAVLAESSGLPPAVVTATETGITESNTLSAEQATEAGYRLYPIQHSRRMRSKEMHYIDHPLLGIIIQLTPIELIEPAPSDQPT